MIVMKFDFIFHIVHVEVCKIKIDNNSIISLQYFPVKGISKHLKNSMKRIYAELRKKNLRAKSV